MFFCCGSCRTRPKGAWSEWVEGMEGVGLLGGVNGWTMLLVSSVDGWRGVGGNGDEGRIDEE